MAVKVVLLPAQMVSDGVLMLTDGISAEVVAMDNALLVADVVIAHEALLVIATVTTSPLTIEEIVNVALFVPTLEPFIFH